MYDGKVVLCGANSYEEKYYLNPDFEQLPDDVKNELKLVLRGEDIGTIQSYRGDKNPETAFQYLQNKGELVRELEAAGAELIAELMKIGGDVYGNS